MTKIEVQLNTLREQVEKLKPVEGEEEKPITRAELHALGKSVQTILMVKRQILGMSAEDFAPE
jgi:ribosome-binding protein aMBF1 (putative translation factor)